MWHKYDAYIGNRVREIREKQGFTQEELSAKLQVHGWDISRSSLSKIEIGRRHLYPWEIKALKEVLNVSYDDLFV